MAFRGFSNLHVCKELQCALLETISVMRKKAGPAAEAASQGCIANGCFLQRHFIASC